MKYPLVVKYSLLVAAVIALPWNHPAAPQAVGPPALAVTPYQPAEIPGMVRIGNKGYFLSAAKWDSLTIPVCWEPDTPKGSDRDLVQKAVTDSWQAHSHLRFIGWTDCAPNAVGIRIAVRDDGTDDGPHTILLGKFLSGRPNGMVLNFTFRTWSQACLEPTKTLSGEEHRQSCILSIAVPEFGHAIGFAHEQNRNDTSGECAKLRQGPDGDVMLTPWDLKSVMNYCNPTYNNNGI
jgi:hypothetical protein